VIKPRTPGQAKYLDALLEHDLVVGLGPAGTGKTYLAVAVGVSLLARGEVDRLILSRPAVEAGERLGFLPGDMKEKVDPYLRPLYDALHDMLPAEQIERRIAEGVIEVAPLAFMRGRTLAHSYCILDEAQNCTPQQMKMFLTRLGDGARMAVTGDPTQTDLPLGQVSGLSEAQTVLAGVEGVAMTEFTDADVVRHPLVQRIVRAYAAFDARRGTSPKRPS
jgi:phosphate starvation-inducible PhoH-like protein